MADSQLLAPWEYEGEVPQIVESGELIYRGRPTRFELLQRGQSYDFRVSHVGDDGSWDVVLSDRRRGVAEILGGGFREAVKRNWIRREFYVDSEILRIRPNGVGYWYQNYHIMSGFHLGRNVADLTSSQTYQMILDLLAKPSSDVAFALKFKRMDYGEKKNWVFGVDTSEELTRVRAELSIL